MKRHALILFLIGCLNLSGQVSLDYYLGSKNDYNPEIPKPEGSDGNHPVSGITQNNKQGNL